MKHSQKAPSLERIRRTTMIMMILPLLALTTMVCSQEIPQPETTVDQSKPSLQSKPRIDWTQVNPLEQEALTQQLKSQDWPLRVFALLRLERFSGEDIQRMVRESIKDRTWQVRCFALRQAAQLGIEVTKDDLAGEIEPHVIRAAMRIGVVLDDDFVIAGTQKLMRLHDIEMLLGLEIAAASDIEILRDEATKRFTRVINNMNDMILARTSRRLAGIAGIDPPPQNLDQWRAWYKANRKKIAITSPVSETGVKREPLNKIAVMDLESYSRLIDYMHFLKQRDLEVAIAMDFTNSMTPMINQAKAGADLIIVFLNDISHTMRLAFVAYRSHETRPNVEAHDFTQDVKSVRDFLFNVRIIGGREFPEAVLSGLTTCAGFEWSEGAVKQIILVGDAPSFSNEVSQVMNLVESLQQREITIHTVHAPVPWGFYRHVSDQWLSDFNISTGQFFSDIAYRGGGRKVQLKDAEQLVPSIMHFSLEESWWPVFDEFYRLYLDTCR